MCFRPATVQMDKKCPLCNNSNTLDATVCGACGTELPEVPDTDTLLQSEAKMPGAFGDSGTAGGGFQPRIPQAPGAPGAPTKPAGAKPPKPSKP